MTKHKYLTNQQFLQELATRLPDFTEEEFTTFLKLFHEHQGRFMKLLQNQNPQIHNWIQEKRQQLEQENTDKKVETLRKSLAKK